MAQNEQFEYKQNSRLLIMNGVPSVLDKDGNWYSTGPDKYGTWYYQWTGKTLKLIKFEKKKGSMDPPASLILARTEAHCDLGVAYSKELRPSL